MICPGCQHDNRAARRYCGRCGCNFEPACEGCGFANDREDRFCGGCGLALRARNAQVPALCDSRELAADLPEIGISQNDVDRLFGDVL
ncbi:MAG TPA: zinc ribbon domain-containing protein [Kofleriaceae bacterium]|nr:zinc ribbon domain-containing protein [Kofleriaceae bacterium]